MTTLTVAANIKAQMARTATTQQILADALHLSQTAISRRLSGHVCFTIDELVAIAAVLGVPVVDLLEDIAA